MLTIEQRVSNGIDLLNQRGPKDWLDRIVMTDFRIGSTCNCVLGFVYSDIRDNVPYSIIETGYYLGLVSLSLLSPRDCAFDSYESFEQPLLQAEWTRRLTQLKAERAAQHVEPESNDHGIIVETHEASVATKPL